MSKHRNPLKPTRWAYLKSLRLGPGRYLHVSCKCGMRANPFNALAPALPWVESPGKTYNVGANAAKRARRAA